MRKNVGKRNSGGFVVVGALFVLVMIIALLAAIAGWWMNLVKFIKSDFEASYKSEIIRGIGIPCAPLGMVAGWMDIGDEGKEEVIPVNIMIQAFPEGGADDSKTGS